MQSFKKVKPSHYRLKKTTPLLRHHFLYCLLLQVKSIHKKACYACESIMEFNVPSVKPAWQQGFAFNLLPLVF